MLMVDYIMTMGVFHGVHSEISMDSVTKLVGEVLLGSTDLFCLDQAVNTCRFTSLLCFDILLLLNIVITIERKYIAELSLSPN